MSKKNKDETKQTEVIDLGEDSEAARELSAFFVHSEIALKYAAKIFGDADQAIIWFTSPSAALGNNSCPANLLSTPEGLQTIMQILRNMENGLPA